MVLYFFVAQSRQVINKRRNKRHISSKRVVFAVDTCAATLFVGGGGRGVAKAPPPRLVKEERVDAATFFERSLSDEKECALFFRGVGLVFKKAVINCGRE